MAFRVRFVASDVPPVELEPEDAARLLEALGARVPDDALGMPDLVSRLEDGGRKGDEMTIDERQADELLVALRKIGADGELSDPLARLNVALIAYRTA